MPPPIMTINDVVDVFSEDLLIVDPVPIHAALGALIANYLPGDPVWLLIVGPPSSGKTEIVNAMTGLPDVHEISTFTEAALLSGSTSKNGEGSGGVLRQFRIDDRDTTFGLLVFKDFTSLLSENHETRAGLLAALREIFDGRWIRRLGTQGGLTLAWKGKAGLLGAVTETIDRQAAVMGAMGERFILVRMPELDDDQRVDQGRRALANAGSEENMRQHHIAAVSILMRAIDLRRPRPTPPVDLALLADLTTRVRSTVETGQHGGIELVPQAEQAGRLARVLAQLDYGMTVGGLTENQRTTALQRVALDSIPKHRLQIIRLLVEHPEAGWTADTIANRTGLIDAGTVERHLFTLAAHRIVERHGAGGRDTWTPTQWTRDRINMFTDRPRIQAPS
jgi:hypothetical protein